MKPLHQKMQEKYRTFPSKSSSTKPMPNNKFQRMAIIHREQEKQGEFCGNQRKIYFGGTPKLEYREGGKFYKPPKIENDAEETKQFCGKTQKLEIKRVGKKFGKKEKHGGIFQKKKFERVKDNPVKTTSTEYDQLGNSDDEGSVMDVTDMIPMEEDEEEIHSEIPLINIYKQESVEKVTKPFQFSSKNRINARGDHDEVEKPDAPTLTKKHKTSLRSDDNSDDPEKQEDGSDGDNEEDDEEDDEEERLKFRIKISQMPLGKVKEMKEKLGIKLFNKTYFGTSEAERNKIEEKKKEKTEAVGKAEKGGQHRPREISSKRPGRKGLFRHIYAEHERGTKKKRWDPRFDSRAGEFKEVCFENNYQFLDELRTGEMQDLRNEYNAARADGDEKKAAITKNILQKMETREKTRAEKRRQAQTRKDLHDDNIERMLRGEAPIFRTKAQVRRIDAEKKYEELKKDNKLDKYLQKKAKKESAKQKKARPLEGYAYQN